jgi:hypothetical protein
MTTTHMKTKTEPSSEKQCISHRIPEAMDNSNINWYDSMFSYDDRGAASVGPSNQGALHV